MSLPEVKRKQIWLNNYYNVVIEEGYEFAILWVVDYKDIGLSVYAEKPNLSNYNVGHHRSWLLQ